MNAQKQTYIVRKPDGEELPPADAETLLEWVRQNHITRDCEIRSRLVLRWTPVTDQEFLRDALDEHQPLTKHQQKSARKKRQPSDQDARTGSHALEERVIPYTPAGLALRFFSGLFDVIIIGILTAIVSLCLFAVFPPGSDVGYLITIGFCSVVVLLYYTWSIAFRAQTLGQRFWGVMVVKTNSTPVYALRATFFSVLTLLLGIPSFILMFLSITNRSIAERLTSTRVIFIRICYNLSQETS